VVRGCHGQVLYFGISAFWSALRAADGDATADLATRGPRWIGRFDLANERFLPPLDLRPGGAATGVWDVLVHPNGQLYFTTYFDLAGRVDPETGAVQEFANAGLGLNELALGPAGQVLVTRYGFGGDDEGSLVVLSERGEILAEHVLPDPPGLRAQAKSLAFDPLRRRLAEHGPLPTREARRHDARVSTGGPRAAAGSPSCSSSRSPDGMGFFCGSERAAAARAVAEGLIASSARDGFPRLTSRGARRARWRWS
jgi:hypothetical protein